jgi:hypothetical protein
LPVRNGILLANTFSATLQSIEDIFCLIRVY